MNHADHVRLIEAGIGRGSGGVWADFGAGGGAFTLALRDVAGSNVEIVAVDRDPGSLQYLRDAMGRQFPDSHLHLLETDFTGELQLPSLDGILAANAIHYVPWQDQASLLRRWRAYLKPGGRLVVVEYDTGVGNRWVPYPMSLTSFRTTAPAAGLAEPVPIGSVPSRFLGRMYAAVTTPVSEAASAG